jgi:hypothetical protein
MSSASPQSGVHHLFASARGALALGADILQQSLRDGHYVIATDRSRTIEYQRCHRARLLGYHWAGEGLQLSKLNIPLNTGIYTHHGLAMILGGADIEDAVKDATAKYWDEIARRGILVEPGEDAAYVADEQTALVEAMLRAWHKIKLAHLLEDYEVIEVEQEDVWKMSTWEDVVGLFAAAAGEITQADLFWMSRLDALIMERCSGDLYIQSFKTASSWDARKSRENEHDMQGLSELAAVEARLHRAWTTLQANPSWDGKGTISSARLMEILRNSPHPPRIAGVKMEFLLKGTRYEDKQGSGHRVQHSPLIRAYRKEGVTGADSEFAWKWGWTDPDTGKERKLPWQSWKPFEVWKANGGVKAWIDLLAIGGVQPEAGDCLSQQFITPVPYFRQDDDVRDWYQQTVFQEVRVGEQLTMLAELVQQHGWNLAHPAIRAHVNEFFPQTRRACDWPSPCAFIDICFSPNVSADPIGSGIYAARQPHHDPEVLARQQNRLVVIDGLKEKGKGKGE